MAEVKILVVSMPEFENRRRRIRAAMADVGAAIEFVYSPYPYDCNPAYMTGARGRGNNEQRKSNYLAAIRSCCDGHAAALHRFITRDSEPYLLLLEDDVRPVPDFAKRLEALIDDIYHHVGIWTAVNVFPREQNWHGSTNFTREIATNMLYKGIYSYGTLGYLYNRQGNLEDLCRGYAFSRRELDLWLRDVGVTFPKKYKFFTAREPLVDFSDHPSEIVPGHYAPEQLKRGLVRKT